MIHIIQADTPALAVEAKTLFKEYARSLDFDLGFQHFDKEMARFPGEYTPPGGALLLALLDNTPVGCVGLRPIDSICCEMKRLYVKEQFRGSSAGRTLVEKIIDTARQLDYSAIRLDTLPSMAQANRLYKKFGFAQIAPYRYNPLPEAIYLELKL